MLYHVSAAAGLTVLEPRVSTHRKPYVYAVDSLPMGLLFGAKKDDFDLLIDRDDAGRPEAWECYPGALEQVYQGKACRVYQVPEAGFLRGQTGWEPELVCESPVPVAGEQAVDDLYRRLLEEEAAGRLILHRYRKEPEYRRQIAAHVVDRLLRFDVDLEAVLQRDLRFVQHYGALVEGLRTVLDGHLLA